MPTAPTPIDAGPSVPNANDPEATFDAMFEAFLTWLSTELQPQANALAENVHDNAVEAATAATTATTQAGIATTQASASAASAASALTAPGTDATSTTSLVVGTGSKSLTIATGKSFSIGQQVVIARTSAPTTTNMSGRIASHNSGSGALTVTVTANEGSGTYTDWTVSLSPPGGATTIPEIKQRTITGNDTMVTGDRQKVLHWTGTAAGTLSLPAASGNDGLYCTLRNGTNTDWTIDPNASELICGVATIVVKPGYTGLLKCDGTGWEILWTKTRQYFGPYLVTVSDTWTVPADTYVIRPYVVGQGSAGTTTTFGAGGGMAFGDIAVTPGQVVTRSISGGVAKITIGGVDMLVGNPASGATAGTASKHASVTNGGAYSGGAGGTANRGGSSSGSPLGPGVTNTGTNTGGAGWGGAGAAGGGGGTGGPATTNAAGPSASATYPSAVDPLLAMLNGAPGVFGGASIGGGNGGPGAGGGSGAALAGVGGIGAGSGAAAGGAPPGAPGFGGGGGANTSVGIAGGAGGYGGGGAASASGGSTGGAGGAAAIIFLTGVPS